MDRSRSISKASKWSCDHCKSLWPALRNQRSRPQGRHDQHSMKIAIQGERGSFSHEAALRMLPGCSVVPCGRSAEVFDRLAKRTAQAAVIPIENSLAGPVSEHFDLLLAQDVFVQREFRLRINHNLIAAPGVQLKHIRRVFSHPVALDQCRDFFRRHKNIHPEPFYDTAGSVKHVIENDLHDAAAIAPRQAAAEFGSIAQKPYSPAENLISEARSPVSLDHDLCWESSRHAWNSANRDASRSGGRSSLAMRRLSDRTAAATW